MYLHKKSKIAVLLMLLLALVVTSVLYLFAGDGITGATITAGQETSLRMQEISPQNISVISVLILNTTNLATNNTDTNLTAYSTISGAGTLKTIYNNWFLNGTTSQTIMVNLPFEGGSGGAGGTTRDYSGYNNNASVVGAVGATWNSTGGIDQKGAYRLSSAAYLEVTDTPAAFESSLNPPRVITLSIWLRPTSTQSATIIDKQTGGNTDGYLLKLDNNRPNMSIGTNSVSSTYTLPNAAYSHVVGLFNGTDILIYVNGTLNATASTSAGTTITTNGSTNLRIGVNQTGGSGYDGHVDEVTIWNRSLSSEQIWTLYQNLSNVLAAQETFRGENWSVLATPNNGSSSPSLADGNSIMSNNVTILAVPFVDITLPANGSNFSNSTQTFRATVLPTVSTTSTVLIMFNTNTTPFNVTASESAVNVWDASVSMLRLVELKNHTATFYANDTNKQINQTERVVFTVDRTPPNVSDLTPRNGSNFSNNVPLQDFNASIFDNLTLVDTVIFQFSNGTTPFNKTGTNISGVWRVATLAGLNAINISSLVEGLQGVRIFANDTLNNLNDSSVINFTVDRTAPVVNITSHVTGATVSSTVNFNATVTENLTVVNAVIFQFTNGTAVAPAAFNRTASNTSGSWNVSVDTGYMADGEHTISVYANDTVGNLNIPLAVNNALITITVSNAAGTTGATGGTATSTAAGEAVATSTTGETAATTTTGEAAATTAAGETATATAAAAAFQSGQASASISQTGTTATTAYISEQSYKVAITNNLNQKLLLSGVVKVSEKQLENEDNIVKRLKEELLLEGEVDETALERELSILKLLESVEILQVYKTRLSHFLPSSLVGAAATTPLVPTGKRIEANLIRDSVLNQEELQQIEVNPGETLEKEIKIRRGLHLGRKEPLKIIFSSGGEEVLVKEIQAQEELVTGTAVDVNPETKKFDFYIIIPPQQGRGKEKFTVEMDLNVKKTKAASSPLPLKIKLPFFSDEASKSIFSELYGPYNVNLERGALLAVQYDASAIQGEYEAVGKIFGKHGELVAENHFEIKMK